MPLTEPDLWISHIRLFSVTFWRCERVKAVHDLRDGQRVVSEVFREPLPVHLAFLAASVEPLLNHVQRSAVEPPQADIVFADAVVPEMSAQLGREDLPPLFGRSPVADRF